LVDSMSVFEWCEARGSVDACVGCCVCGLGTIRFRGRVLGYGGKGCCSLVDAETGLDAEGLDMLGDDESC
jgi:hypothetical protein